ncbi:MAG TPA: transposase [Streptosporangiaceae bacterium]|nr:transposase [Streptosporangiaceae bacterium]
MSRKYLSVDRDQPMMLAEDMRLWVDAGHLVWFVIEVIEGLDPAPLRSLGKPGKGRRGYDPVMLAVLLIYSYLQGERSSRKIEQRCRTDAAFRVATGNRIPDHSTICRFRAGAAAEDGPLEDLFTQVLFVLAAAGLGRLDVISVDGSKVWAHASKEANRTENGLRKLARKILEEAARADGEDCGCDGHEHGEAAGLDGPPACGCCDGGMLPGLGLDGPAVPRGGWGGASRAQRIAAGLADLEASRLAREGERRAAADAYLAAARDGTAPRGSVPAAVAVEVAQIRLEQALDKDASTDARWAAAGRALPGRRRAGQDSAAVRKARRRLDAAVQSRAESRAAAAAARDSGKTPQPVRNITDPDSRLMHCTLRGLVQSYNAQCRRTRDGVYLLPRVVQDPNDARQVQTAIEDIGRSRQVIAAGHAAGGHPGTWSAAGTLLFDPGYFSKDNLELDGPDRLIGTSGGWKDTTARHGPGCTHDDPRDQMACNLSTRQGRDLYRHRAPLSEGGFAELKGRTGLRQLAMRGLARAQGELLLATGALNIHLLYRRTRQA